MSQLRHDYSKFKEMNTEVLVMVPNGPRTIEGYVNRHEVPYPILSDKGSKVASEYSQIKKFLIAGTPTVILVNTSGEILYTHYAKSLVEEPDNREPLDVLGWRPGSMAPAVQAL